MNFWAHPRSPVLFRAPSLLCIPFILWFLFCPVDRTSEQTKSRLAFKRFFFRVLSLFVRFRVGWWFQVSGANRLEPRSHTKSHEQNCRTPSNIQIRGMYRNKKKLLRTRNSSFLPATHFQNKLRLNSNYQRTPKRRPLYT